ncbi:Protein phosphatase 1 regulatory subunit 3B [Clonorchis sinensis]|uniref:Protein phosphatase 1 regulatory subunit 3B n=1 Tax=Clonorchis sinensis TaxID=79923 RepID=A0A8T1MMR0_CLOSI|nr:Protein phosphatase 1 regulatory subunit 3B [Clonorchis sinensis]
MLDEGENGIVEPEHKKVLDEPLSKTSNDSNPKSPSLSASCQSSCEVPPTTPEIPKQDEPAPDIDSTVPSAENDHRVTSLEPGDSEMSTERLREKSPTRYSHLSAAKSPTTWPDRQYGMSRSIPFRPAFVYCGPGTKRIPGVSAQACTTSTKETSNSQPSVLPNSISTTLRRTSHTSNAARSALPAHSKSPNWLLGVTEQPGITITSAHQGVSLSTAPIQPLGDASQKISPASRPVNSVGNRTAHAGQQNKPFKSTVAGNSCYTGVWRGPEFVTERLSRWSLSADMLDHVPSSNDVFLSGIILQPGTYLRAKNNVGKPVLIEPDVVFGVIRVHNYTYEKSVTVRATCDRWLTYVDQPAKYVTSYDTSSSVKSKFDTFAFRFPLPDSSEEFEFAIHYRWLTPSGGGSAWDNNGGRNYIINRKRFEMNKPKVEVTEVLDSVLGVSS